MFFLLRRYLKETVRKGRLRVVNAEGESHEFGDRTGPLVGVRISDPSLYWKLALFPDPIAGEAYMDGSLTLFRGSIYDLLELLSSQSPDAANTSWNAIEKPRLVRRQTNRPGEARRNVAHHYDLSRSLFELFLDRDLQYSCAYFETANQSLDEAQLAKKRHLAAKLALSPGMKVLDIGSGWGGLALFLAETCDVKVVGVTLSEEQFNLSNLRIRERGLHDKVEIRLQDYRTLDEKFDRIVSVGMFEHVGIGNYSEFFGKLRSLLTDEGVAVLHTIGRSSGPMNTSRWIDKYIFPGGHIPAISEIAPAIEQSGLYLCDLEILRLHYARTLQEWRRLFAENRDRAKNLYDETFCRMWEFYLASSEVSFRHYGMNVFQFQFSRQLNSLPICRSYMESEEERLKAQEQTNAPDPQMQLVNRE